MAKKIEFDQIDLILREIYRNYESFRDYFARTGRDCIDYGPLTISLIDLQYGLDGLSKRKMEAFKYHVLMDMKQKDVAEIMGITTVSVGQYVKAAMQHLAERYFSEVDEEKLRVFMEFEAVKAKGREARAKQREEQRATYVVCDFIYYFGNPEEQEEETDDISNHPW